MVFFMEKKCFYIQAALKQEHHELGFDDEDQPLIVSESRGPFTKLE